MSAFLIALAVGGGVFSAKGQIDAAKTESFELERQADQEKIAAEGRELQRRQKLNKILSANIVGLATSGIKGEGTPQSLALASAKQVSVSEGIEALSDRLKQAQLRRQAKNVRKSGRLAAFSTLLTAGIQAASLSEPEPKGKNNAKK